MGEGDSESLSQGLGISHRSGGGNAEGNAHGQIGEVERTMLAATTNTAGLSAAVPNTDGEGSRRG